MDNVAVTRLNARYRLPASAAAQKERLDRILSEAVEGILEAALERAGVPVQEEICIRSVHSVARLRLSSPDSTLATAWSLALAEAIRRCVGRPGADLVHYGSRHHALVDLVTSVAGGDLRRAWAWRQMGLWTAAEGVGAEAAFEGAMRALAAEPQAGAAALGAAVRLGALPRLLARVRWERWQNVTRAALAAVGAPADLSAIDAAPPIASPAILQNAARILRRSAIAQAAAALPAEMLDAARARALAVLAALEVEPASLRRGGPFARALTGAVERGLRGGPPIGVEPAPDRVHLAATAGGDDPGPALDGPSPGVERGTASSVAISDDTRAGKPLTPARVLASGTETSGAAAVETPLPEVRRRATTGTAGLLFLVHIVGEMGLPDEIAGDEHVGDRPLRWVLHRLALALAPIEPDDPAALAFAGLGPDAEPPSIREEEATEAELAAVDGLRSRMVAALRQRLERPEDPEELPLVQFCRRRAEVVADPGWIEIRLALDEASTEVRRAGLDLEPGWLPWLGVVMRLVYA